MIIKWWKIWFGRKKVKSFCYFCHTQILDSDEVSKIVIQKPDKPVREAVVHMECMHEDHIFTNLGGTKL